MLLLPTTVSAQSTVAIDTNNSVQARYAVQEKSSVLTIGADRYWSNGWYSAFDASQEHYEQTSATTSQSVEIQKELRYPWLGGLYVNRWDGADAVSDTTYELKLAWFGENTDVTLLAGRHDLQLSATRRQGQLLQREFVTDFIGMQFGYLPIEGLTLSIGATRYTHDFDFSSLNLANRPLLQLFLSPDTIATLGGLIDNAFNFSLTFQREKWTIDGQASIFNSSLELSDSQLLSAGLDYQLSARWSINADFGRRFTNNADTSDFLGIGARLLF